MSQNTPSEWTFTYSVPQKAVPLTPITSSGFFPSYPASLSGTPIYSTPSTPTPNPNKRKGKENIPSTSKKARGSLLSGNTLPTGQKLRLFYGFLKHELNWTYGELLYHTSIPFSGDPGTATPISSVTLCSSNRPEASREQMTATMQHFFNGKGKHTPAKIIENWYKHSYGRLERESEHMFSLSTLYTDIGPVRPALSSFSAQLVSKKLLDEAEKAVDSKSGLHVSLMGKQKYAKDIAWTDIGASTTQKTQDLIEKNQPLTWGLILSLCTRRPRVQGTVKVVRQKRPPNIVSTGIISTINFTRTSRARLLPLSTAILYLGSSASTDLFRYRSRLGQMPSYSSTLKAMRALSEHEATITLQHGKDVNTIGIIRLDNVQNYLLQRDPSIGRENKMNVGLAATYYEIDLDGIDINTFNLEAKKKSLEATTRANLTEEILQNLIDHQHIENVCILQWISTLVNHVPELSGFKDDVSRLYKTRVAKNRLKVQPSKVHPLASSSRNETITTEFKDALLDFFSQVGQTPESFKPRLLCVGGDGLTYQKMVELKEYLQFHSNDVESFRVMQPMLEWWHTEWTNLSRLFESHWGDLHSQDPSSLGHSAEKIGRKKPSNLKKVDFYTSSDLAFTVLDARILDCWRLLYQQEDLFQYFKSKAKDGTLPNFEDLEHDARKLYRSYTSLRAQERALRGGNFIKYSTVVPAGSEWLPQTTHTDSNPSPVLETVDDTTTKSKSTPPEVPFCGDEVLARSISFIRDTMLAREFSLATADGDVGRIWEMIKVMLFTFAGSTHSNYTHYLLEMITDLELESSRDLRDNLLKLTLVNLSGREGHWSAGDFIQEYFNRLLESIVQRKGIEYGDTFIRKTWARNLHHIARLKLSWLDGVGLKRRSAKHHGAKMRAELKILIQLYKECELHSFRAFRRILSALSKPGPLPTFLDDYQKGILNLRGSKLKRWIKKTSRSRNLNVLPTIPTAETGESDTDNEGSDSDSEEDGDNGPALVHGNNEHQYLRYTAVIDGELVVDRVDDDEIAQTIEDCIDSYSESEESESYDED